jgi:shikimate kinase
LGRFLDLPVQDIDEVIADRARKSIPRIFAEDGEPAFRQMEAEITSEAFQSPAVLALGGGAWESQSIREAAQNSNYSVLWIAENPGRIWNRVAQDPGRPLAQDRQIFLARSRARMPRWMELPMILPLGRTPGQLASVLIDCMGHA